MSCGKKSPRPERLMHARDPSKSQAVMKAMLQMDKIDTAGVKRAYDQQQRGAE